MIDDFTEVKELIGKMQATLPIPVYPSKAFIHIMREQGVKVKSKHELLIEKVVYLGDEGGIACVLKLPGHKEKVFITSLTHLRVKTNHPLAKDIRAYQIKRTKKLAQ
jgi:hypothetical protein